MPAHFARRLALPPEVEAQGIALRGETDADLPFLERLYVSVRWEELAATTWPEPAKLVFLRDQLRLQRLHYATYYVETDYGIVAAHGTPIGRLYLDRGPTELRIVDIALVPEWRHRGIGTALLRAVCAEAAADGTIVSIHVEQFNPAQRLYRRLGFREVATDGPY